MLLISIDVEYKYNLIEKIRLEKGNVKTNIFVSDDLNYNFDYKNYDFIITEYNIKKIDYFTAIEKNVIICNFEDEEIESSYLKHDNVSVCKSIDDVIRVINSKPPKKKSVFNNIDLRKAIPACLIVFAIALTLIGVSKIDLKDNNTNKDNTKQVDKSNKETTKKEPDFGKENYLFLGDSITDFYPLENYYGDLPVVNSGISGNQCTSILSNMENRVYRYNPTAVFLLIGTNDIAYSDVTDEELVDNIIEICDLIHKNRKRTQIYVESIYPVNKTTDNDKVNLGMVTIRENSRITKINKLLKEKVEEKKYHYIDMYSVLADEDGNLNLDYTNDGLHMSEEGYEVITKEIKKIIYNNNI